MAKPLASDELWDAVAPLLPPPRPKPKGGHPPVADRAVPRVKPVGCGSLTGILFVLKSGIPWEMPPQEMGCGAGMTCWRRLLSLSKGRRSGARAGDPGAAPPSCMATRPMTPAPVATPAGGAASSPASPDMASKAARNSAVIAG
jgi:transposase